jgi:hypothetical protein
MKSRILIQCDHQCVERENPGSDFDFSNDLLDDLEQVISLLWASGPNLASKETS